MLYEKQNWISYDDNKTEEENIQAGAVVTAERMNHLENGIAEHDKNMSNPHKVTKAQIGLENVDNVKQASKSEFDLHLSNKSNPHKVTASQVGAYTKIESDSRFVTQTNTEKGLMIYKNQYITTENWDDFQESGIYYCAGATGENMPVQGTLYGNLIVIKTAGVIIQQFLSNGMFYTRTMIGSPMAWNPWSRLASDVAVVHSSGNESIDGFKDFRQTPTVKGVNLAKETFGVTLTGGQLGGVEVKDGTILKWGTPYSYDNERSRNNDLFTISSDLKTMTILKECTLQFNGKFTCQTGDAKYYAYLEIAVNGSSKWRAAGIAGSVNWRNDVGWFMVRKFNAGDKVTLVTGTNYKSDSVNAWGVDQLHIQEVIKA